MKFIAKEVKLEMKYDLETGTAEQMIADEENHPSSQSSLPHHQHVLQQSESDPKGRRSSLSLGWIIILSVFLWWLYSNPVHEMAFETHRQTQSHRRLVMMMAPTQGR